MSTRRDPHGAVVHASTRACLPRHFLTEGIHALNSSPKNTEVITCGIAGTFCHVDASLSIDTHMDIWQEIAVNQEAGAKRLAAECGDRLFAAAIVLLSGQG